MPFGRRFLAWQFLSDRLLDEGLVRIDARTGAGVSLLPKTTGSVAVAGDAVWVADYEGPLNRVNPATNQIEASYNLKSGATRVAIGFGSIWVAYCDRSLVQRFDLAP